MFLVFGNSNFLCKDIILTGHMSNVNTRFHRHMHELGYIEKKQGRIHGNPVADSWAGAVMRKPLAIQKYFGPTDRHGKV